MELKFIPQYKIEILPGEAIIEESLEALLETIIKNEVNLSILLERRKTGGYFNEVNFQIIKYDVCELPEGHFFDESQVPFGDRESQAKRQAEANSINKIFTKSEVVIRGFDLFDTIEEKYRDLYSIVKKKMDSDELLQAEARMKRVQNINREKIKQHLELLEDLKKKYPDDYKQLTEEV